MSHRRGTGTHTLLVTFTNNVTNGIGTVTSGNGSSLRRADIFDNVMNVNLTGVTDAQPVVVTLSGVNDAVCRKVRSPQPITNECARGRHDW